MPSGANRAEPLLILDSQVCKEHLVKAALAIRLLDRPHLNARRMHVNIKHGQTTMLRHGRVGSSEQQAKVGDLRKAGPDLLTVDEPAFRDCARAGTDAGEIRARARLREQLAPDLLTR